MDRAASSLSVVPECPLCAGRADHVALGQSERKVSPSLVFGGAPLALLGVEGLGRRAGGVTTPAPHGADPPPPQPGLEPAASLGGGASVQGLPQGTAGGHRAVCHMGCFLPAIDGPCSLGFGSCSC